MASTEEGERSDVRHELGRLRAFAASLRLDEVRDGTWFSKLLAYSLETYARTVDADHLRDTYAGMPPDAVAQARVQLAARHAGIEGALSAGAYTGAVAATLGSAAGASPITVPAAAASFVADLLFTSQLQLRLAHDIALLYGVPVDLDDPEDIWKLIRVAFGIKGSEVGARVAATSLPVVGKLLLQRSVAKFVVPGVGIPLTAGINRWSTRAAGTQAIRLFRTEGRIVEAAQSMATGTPHPTELLWVLWRVVLADALTHENERLLLRHVTATVADLESELAALGELRSTTDLDESRIVAMLGAAQGDLTPLYDAAVVAAAVDGKVNRNELAVLRMLAGHCGATYDEEAVRRLATMYATGS